MIDAFVHLDESLRDPVGKLAGEMEVAGVSRALIVEKWDRADRRALESLMIGESHCFRLVVCYRKEEWKWLRSSVEHEQVVGIRVALENLIDTNPAISLADDQGLWLLPHAKSGGMELSRKLLALAERFRNLRFYIPHLAWPTPGDPASWKCGTSQLGKLANSVIGISTMDYFSSVPFPHEDIRPFANHLMKLFTGDSVAIAGGYPVGGEALYEAHLRLAKSWVQSFFPDWVDSPERLLEIERYVESER